MKYFLYTRKSTEEEEKQVLSLDTQLDKAREIFPHLDIIELPPESASAFKPGNRPIFDNMLERIDAGEAHGIVAWHPDRCSRNEIEAAAITYRLRTGKILDLKFCSYTFDNSPEGIMMLQMVMSQSQYFSAKLSKDVKRGNGQKIKMGWKPGWAPTGYLNTPDLEKGSKKIVIDPDRFTLVKKMWELMLTGNYSVPQIWYIATNDWGFTLRKTRKTGGGPISRTGLYGVFTNPFYAGLIRYNDDVHKGKQKAMITVAEYDRVQQLLGRKGKPRPKTHDITYRGPMVCGECGCTITAEVKQKYLKNSGETREYIYYHCTRKRPCSQRGAMTEKEIEQETEKVLSSITILPEFRDWALEVLSENNDQEIEDRTSVHESQSKALLATQKQLDNLTKMRLKDLINDEEYIEQREKLSAETRRLKELLLDTQERAEKWLELTEKAFDIATYARQNFIDGDAETCREIFINLGSSFILKDNKLSIQPHEWFVPIQKEYPRIEQLFREVRTRKYASSKEKTAAFTAVRSQWLRGLDSNQRPRR